MNGRSVGLIALLAALTLLPLATISLASGAHLPLAARADDDSQDVWQHVAAFFGQSGIRGNYGFSVDVSGDIAVVGDGYLYVNGLGNAGAAYIYERDEISGDWFEVKELHAPSPHTCGHFGAAVAVNGAADTIIVGEPGRRNHPDCKQDGSIYFFGRDEGGPDNWGLLHTIDGSGAYGKPLTIDGDTLAVGVPGDTTNTTCANGLAETPHYIAGFVELYRQDEGGLNNWGLVKRIDPPWNQENDKHFGCAIAISGNRLAVGAPDYGEMGMAFLYDGDQDWALVDTLEGFQRWNTFGFAVAVSAEHFFISAPLESIDRGDEDLNRAGQVYPAGSSTGLPYPQLPEPDPSHIVGTALALDGEFLAVTYIGTNELEVHDDVLIYRDGPLGWELVQVLEAVGPECWSNMSLAMDGDTLIIGETGCLGSGIAHIYERSFGADHHAYLPVVVNQR